MYYYLYIMDRICKNKFSKYVRWVNENKPPMNPEQKVALKTLIQAWNKKDKVVEDLFSIKEQHSYINGVSFNEELWNDYIITCMKFRLEILRHIHAE